MRLEIHRGAGAEACPGDEVLHDVLAARMSWDPIDASAPAKLRASLTKRPRSFVGHVEIRSAGGAVIWQRDLDPMADCGSVVEGLGFVTALKLDPAGPPAGRPVVAAPAPVPAPVVAPAPVTAAPVPPVASAFPALSVAATPVVEAPVLPPVVPAAPLESWPKVVVGLASGVGFGVSPAPVAGMAAIDVGLRWQIPSVALELRAFPIASGPSSTSSSTAITTGLFSAAAIGCAHWKVLAGCGVFDVGALRATATSDHPTTGVVATVRTGVRGTVELPLTEVLAIRVTGDALVPLQRAGLQIDGKTVWTAPVISGGVQAGMLVSF